MVRMASRRKSRSSVQTLGRLKSNLWRLQEQAEKLLDLPANPTTAERLEEPSQTHPRTRRGRTRGRPARGIRERREDLLTSLETQLTRRLATLLERLDIPSRRDIERLSDRIDKLESVLKATRRSPSTKR
jgi:hypothetical protein